MRAIRRFPLGVLLVLMAACDSPSEPVLKTLTIAPGERTLEVGASLKLTVTAKDQSGESIQPGAVTWSVNDTAVATITSDGTLTARKIGEVLATAEAGGKSHVVRIAVVTAAAHSVEIGQDTLVASTGTQVKLNVQIRDARGALTTGSVVTITTSNADVASLESLNDPLRVLTPGTAVVTITVDGARDSIVVRATDATVARMLLPNATNVSSGETIGLDVVPLSAAGEILDNNTVTWTSSDTTIASVSTTSGGVSSHHASVIAKRIGFVRVTARSGDMTQAIDVEVKPAGPKRWQQVVAGTILICALNEDGAAYCAGHNEAGQLGIGTASPMSGSFPTLALAPVKSPWRYLELSARWDGVCGRTAEGFAVCWGKGSETAAGHIGIATPHLIDENLRFVKVHTGFNGACGLTAAGSIYCWNQPLPGNPASIAPSRVAISEIVSDFALAQGSMCYTTTDGRALCLGTVAASQPPSTMRFTSIGAGDSGFCGLSNGVMYCWGNGQAIRAAGFPEPVVTPASINDEEACTTSASGKAYCWKFETQLARLMTGSPFFTQMATGFRDICALASDDIYCWNVTMGHPDRPPSSTTPPVLLPRQATR